MSNPIATSNVVPFIRPTNLNHDDGRPDFRVYEPDLERFGLTPAQREEFVKVLWTILVGFVDLGYGIHPTQHSSVPDDLDDAIFRTVDEYFKDAA
ncbi:hypothetical protein [Sulfitobacter sp. PS-8MA]|uniref:hypothetical protein n=1 Tax=Sulfitobacter sp. PS-8MA TaxID=3237707 RepID=UPI0034C6AEFC